MALATAIRLALSRPQASAHSERPAARAGAITTSVIPHPRIDERIKDIDDQVEHDREHGDYYDGAHDERVIAIERRFHEVPANPGDLEDRLDYDRAGEESRSGRTRIGHDRQECAAQRVLHDYAELRQAKCPCRPDVM